jgi:glycosyltransferase involved in cell wall biosynthesis
VTYSIVIPAHNEEDSIRPVLRALCAALAEAAIPYEIVVVNDHSRDRTRDAVAEVAADYPAVRCVDNEGTGGFGLAVRAGLDAFRGDIVAVVMADGSDPPEDVVRCYRKSSRATTACSGRDSCRAARSWTIRGSSSRSTDWRTTSSRCCSASR